MNENPSVEECEKVLRKKSLEASAFHETLCIWIDADSCPKEVRKFLLRTAKRFRESHSSERQTENGVKCSVAFHFVAAKELPPQEFLLPESGASEVSVCHTLVEPGQDASDHFILQHCNSSDIVITRDIVFAEQLCGKDCDISVLNDRGVEYSRENVSARRRQRDTNLELRQLGVLAQSSKKNHYSAKDLQHFANSFDRCLTRKLKDKRKHSLRAYETTAS